MAIENPLDSLHGVLTSSSRDMSLDRKDAWIYGIVVGWSNGAPDEEDALSEVCALHGWDQSTKERLQRLHAEYTKLSEGFSAPAVPEGA